MIMVLMKNILFSFYKTSENGFHHSIPEYKGIKAPEGEGCPRCGCYVYAAEQMLARGRVCQFFIIFDFGDQFFFLQFLKQTSSDT